MSASPNTKHVQERAVDINALYHWFSIASVMSGIVDISVT